MTVTQLADHMLASLHNARADRSFILSMLTTAHFVFATCNESAPLVSETQFSIYNCNCISTVHHYSGGSLLSFAQEYSQNRP